MYQRQPKDQRMKRPPRMVLMQRDIDVLKAVYEYRVMTHNQIERLVFSSKHPSIAQKRLALLFHHGYLERDFLPTRQGINTSPILYVLAEDGARLISGEYLTFSWSKDQMKASQFFLSHTLSISEFRVRITLACRVAGLPIIDWLGERELKKHYDHVGITATSGKMQRVSIIPDSYFIVKTTQGNQHFALELDRGTMSGKRIKMKVLGYLEYLRSGQYQERYGSSSLRVLFVAETNRRARNLKSFIDNAGGQSRFWIASLDELTRENILAKPVWAVAGRANAELLLPHQA